MNESTEFYSSEEWPHILEQRVSRWHLPLLFDDGVNLPTIEYAPKHDGAVLQDAMSVSFGS